MTEQERLEKNKRISESKRSTIERHSNMLYKTFDVKVQWNQCSKAQKEALNRVFLKQKWLKNYILNWSENPENKINKFDIKQKTITKKNAKMEDEEVTLKYLSSQAKMALVGRLYSNIKTLHTLKSKGLQKCGRLKYSRGNCNRFGSTKCKLPVQIKKKNQNIRFRKSIPNQWFRSIL